MTETRARSLLKEAALRGIEESVTSKLEGMEIRMQKMDTEFKESMAAMFEAIKSLQSNSGSAAIGGGTSPVNHQNFQEHARLRQSYSGLTRLSKIDFPQFNGDKVKEWIFKIEQFFAIDHAPPNLKVGLASIHFDEQAATWHQSLMQSEAGKNVVTDWSGFHSLVLERFEVILDDPIGFYSL